MAAKKGDNAWAWLPALYFLEGLPNTVVMSFSVLFYTSMGLGATATAALTSALYLPWVLKSLWSPIVDSVSTKRMWILGCAAAFALAFLSLAISPFASKWILISISGFWFLGAASATFDIASDGFYMLSLSEQRQAFFVGIRNSFYRLAMIFGSGGLLFIAGFAGRRLGDERAGWCCAFLVCAAISLICILWFSFALPKVEKSPSKSAAQSVKFIECFVKFFARRHIVLMLIYILFYRFAESQICKILPIFMKADRAEGGLGFDLETIGAMATFTPVSLLCGGILGGIMISKYGLKKCMLPMALFMNLPNVIYLFMAICQPHSAALAAGGVLFEHFGYGVGFSSYMMYLIFASKGEYKTAFYAICTGFMALGLQLPSAASGLAADTLGFVGFFWWIMLATLVSFAATFVGIYTLKGADFSGEKRAE
ncbi:MAG: MFS transporter [Opitutales bacterium]|nr:MFS transporter [Opitutales bacterium]